MVSSVEPASFQPRGPVSAAVLDALRGPVAAPDEHLGALRAALRDSMRLHRTTPTDSPSAVNREPGGVATDDDLQLALFALYGLHYGSVVETDDRWEWHPELVRARSVIEDAYERELRAAVQLPGLPEPSVDAVAAALFDLTAPDAGPSLSKYVAREATEEQVTEFLVHRSIYTLKEADPHSWAIPRLTGRAKAALVEVQADEYGGGRPERMHSAIFAQAMRASGLDDRYGTYVDNVPAITLASFTMMSMFGLNRRLRGAIAGHLAAFEMTSSVPNRFYGNGFRRLGHGEDSTGYFDEHVEADAVHEQIAGRDLAGSLAEDDPRLLEDIFFGAAACLTVDGWVGQHILEQWTAGRSSLRQPLAASSLSVV